MRHITLDAIPDLSDTQVIIYAKWDRSPDILEDQVTYPLITAMLGVPQGKRHPRFFRFRLLVSSTSSSTKGPTSTGHGPGPSNTSATYSRASPGACRSNWPATKLLSAGYSSMPCRTPPAKHNLAELRSIQDWFMKYELQSLPGVAEVAPVGGFVRQYQVNLDPNALVDLQNPHGQGPERHTGGQ